MSAAVSPEQRHKAAHRCPVCDGADGDPRGRGRRCSGFTSADGLYAHCSRDDIAGAIAANNAGLFAHRLRGSCNCGVSHGSDLPTSGLTPSPVEATYDYVNESNVLLFQVVRKPGKKFLQRAPDGAGGWSWKLNGVRRVLYRLPELIAAPPDRVVHIVEGERDADTLVQRGELATCNPGGAGKWPAVSDLARQVLRERDVVVVADADEVGRRHAQEVVASLDGVARSVKLMESPAPYKDVSDLINAGGTLEQLVMTGALEPSSEDGSDLPEVLRKVPALAKVALIGAVHIREIAARPVSYLWKDIAIAGIIVLLAGGPGEGKTTLLFLVLAARMNLDGPSTLLGRTIEPAPPDKYIVVIEGEHAEGSASRKLIRSFALLGLDDRGLDRTILLARKAVRLGSPEWLDIVTLVRSGLVSDIAIDTVARVAPADADNERDQVAIFDAVAQAIEAAPDSGDKPVVWAVAHTRKNAQTGDLADVSGSAQRTGQADTVLLVKGERVEGRTVASKVTFAKLREEPDDYPVPITFSITNGQVLTSEDRADDDRPLEVRITEQLHMGPKTKNALATALNRSDKHVDDALTNLFAARTIRTTNMTVRGRSCKAFSLRQDGQNLTRLSPDSGGAK